MKLMSPDGGGGGGDGGDDGDTVEERGVDFHSRCLNCLLLASYVREAAGIICHISKN